VALSASNKEAAHFSLGLKAVETAALWKRLEKSKSDFPTPSHRAWKTRSPLHSEFPTVPTASTASSIYFLLKALDKELSPSLAGLGSLRTITSIFREPDTSLAIKTGHLDLLTTEKHLETTHSEQTKPFVPEKQSRRFTSWPSLPPSLRLSGDLIWRLSPTEIRRTIAQSHY
jgi:hypothetical protein